MTSVRDARLRFSRMSPETWRVKGREVEAWDLDGFESMTDVRRPVRVLHTRETQTRRSRASGVWEVRRETSHWWWATTIPRSRLPVGDLWNAGHARWDIENDGFNTLVQAWGLDHCFRHTPQAILNFVLTILVVYVLVQCFYRRNLKPARRTGLTLQAVVRELYAGWVTSGRMLPWPETLLDTS